LSLLLEQKENELKEIKQQFGLNDIITTNEQHDANQIQSIDYSVETNNMDSEVLF
jgi:hypothetical protein